MLFASTRSPSSTDAQVGLCNVRVPVSNTVNAIHLNRPSPRRLLRGASPHGGHRRLLRGTSPHGGPCRLLRGASLHGCPRRLLRGASLHGCPRRLLRGASLHGCPRRLLRGASLHGCPCRLTVVSVAFSKARRLSEWVSL